ncbi:membrane bound O-acyl transferase family-domain-containing protein [Phyllosticta citrichinensis]|uniref:Membrane bound O-acyl transferase family-domain-containing protein n=1 Tax=Phyllosticta citrichinensis TaxID=1130410 RepID=A0ABR1XK60_9PEZI
MKEAGRRWIAIGSLSIVAIWAGLSPWTHDPGAANFAALAWPHWLATIEKFLNNRPTPEAALWPIDKEPGVALSYTPFGFQKLKWAIALILNLRGIRYNFQVKNVQKPRFTSTQRGGVIRFLLWQSIELAYFVIMGDLVAQLGSRLFFAPPPGQRGPPSLFGSGPYFFINMQYTLVSIVFVAIGVSKPEDWSPLFGRLAEATTVRSFWGKFWHQMIRKPLTGLTGRLLDLFGIRRGTNTSSYTQLWLSFAISGFMHAASLTLMPCPANVPERDRWVGLMCYFLWQAAAITLEDFVLFLWRKNFGVGSSGALTNIVGYIWVTCSFWFSLPMAADVLLKLRMGEVSPFPWTLWGPLVDRLFPQYVD